MRRGARVTKATLVLVALVAVAPGLARAAQQPGSDPPDPGRTTTETVRSGGSEYRYLVYRPTSYRPKRRPAPLLVVVHGCQTTAEQELKVTRFNRLAERDGFIVLYADVDALGRALPGPLNQCWKFPYPPAYFRGSSDAGALADMTRAVMGDFAIKDERVYMMGVSAGGLMASVMAAAYPDLYAAVGLVASAGYIDAPCFTTGIGIPVELSAQLAFSQMRGRARVVPRFVIGSNGDLAFPAACSEKALEQGLRTNNLFLSGSQTEPISLAPASVAHKKKHDGYTYTKSTFRDPDGCLIGERWIIDGMPHSWPGGTSDPKYAGYSDPKGPNGAKITWAFFNRYTRRGTAPPCSEARSVAQRHR